MQTREASSAANELNAVWPSHTSKATSASERAKRSAPKPNKLSNAHKASRGKFQSQQAKWASRLTEASAVCKTQQTKHSSCLRSKLRRKSTIFTNQPGRSRQSRPSNSCNLSKSWVKFCLCDLNEFRGRASQVQFTLIKQSERIQKLATCAHTADYDPPPLLVVRMRRRMRVQKGVYI